ncbi:MerR family transcriptional regulator, partial [Cellulomonas pakistanensis]|uniref:MerR family transcriptional regulator n=1 Tax=Cellulomonas pakistanensis TaxID=992287 RepID=UPI001940613D
MQHSEDDGPTDVDGRDAAGDGRDAADGASEGIEPDSPILTVAAVAARLGVAPATLRTWDRRYGLGASEHTAGAHRRYSTADLARLMTMRSLTLDGVPPADAARLAREGAPATLPEPVVAPDRERGPAPRDAAADAPSRHLAAVPDAPDDDRADRADHDDPAAPARPAAAPARPAAPAPSARAPRAARPATPTSVI